MNLSLYIYIYINRCVSHFIRYSNDLLKQFLDKYGKQLKCPNIKEIYGNNRPLNKPSDFAKSVVFKGW